MFRRVLLPLALTGEYAGDQFKHWIEVFGERDESKVGPAGQPPFDGRPAYDLRDNHASVYHART